MADPARGQLCHKRDDLVLALEGRMEERHRFLLATQLRRLEAAETRTNSARAATIFTHNGAPTGAGWLLSTAAWAFV